MARRNFRIIDGGVGTEISRRGVPLHPAYWSATAQITHPDLLRQIHLDYIEAGADIISANTFMARRSVLAAGGCGDFERINREAVGLAREAREISGNAELIVAGCLSTLPPLDDIDDMPRGDWVKQEYREQAECLADSGVDILLIEALHDSESAASMIEACCSTGLQTWAGVSATTLPGSSRLMTFRQPGKFGQMAHEPLDSLLATVSDYPLEFLGVMHTAVDLMLPALNLLQDHWVGRKLAYAKTGVATSHDWEFEDILNANAYADAVRGWIDTVGVEVVGGCCGTGEDHTRALRRLY